MSEAELPVETFRDAAKFLRRPFTKEAVRWKVQSSYPKDEPTFAQVVAYIDARLVIERLNLVIPDWSDTYELAQTGAGGEKGLMLRCNLTVGGITRTDVGKGGGFEAFKSAQSDSLKRAAVKFGVGVSVYAVPIVKMQCGNGNGKLPVKGPEGKKSARIEEAQRRWLAETYADWLKLTGVPVFGDPIDHGDMLGSAGDETETLDLDEPEESLTERLDGDATRSKSRGKRITSGRASEIGAQFANSKLETYDLAVWLNRNVGVDPVPTEGQLPDCIKALKSADADALQAWIEIGVPE